MAEKLIVVDGHSLMYRAFHALPLLDNGEGLYTNAVYGFLSMLFSAIAKERPDYLGVAFDLHGPTFRHEQFADYKATRSPMPDELRPQFDVAKEVLSAMHVPILSAEGAEGDDILGTLSREAKERGIDSLLITGDRDSFQLADEHTTILYTKRGISDTERVTPDFLKDKYGVSPLQLIDIKGLMGDKSDNIPGVPGVGEKTAQKLIAQYGTLEKVLDSAESDQKGALRERLIAGRDMAILSKQLATIDRRADIAWDQGALRLGDIGDAKQALEKYKLMSLIPKLDQLAASAAPKGPEPQQAVSDSFPWQPLAQLATVDELAAWAMEQSGAKQFALRVGAAVSVATIVGAQAVLPLGGDLLSPGAAEDEALGALAPLITSGGELVVHSTKSMDRLLEQYNLSHIGPMHDLMLGAYVLNPQRKTYELQALIADEPGYDPDAPAAAMISLSARQDAQMKQDGLESVYRDMELPLARVLAGMERVGFRVDDIELMRLGAQYDQHISELTASIYAHAGRELNINSPKQLAELLFDQLQLTGGKKTKSGYSTDAETLDQLADAHPVVPKILEYRKYAKLKSTYVDALLRLRGADGRIHTSFDQVATATGRISSNEPNLQNIPVRTELGREIRGAFIAGEGMMLVDADYSQIELRVLAHMSGDQVMIEAFNLGQDIHQRTAAEVYGVPIGEVTKEMRSAAKAVNFGIVYGISDFGLARNIGVSRKEAREFIDRYLSRYPGIKQFMDRCVAEGKLNGYVKTLYGRRRYLPELQSSNYNTRSFGERAAMNSPIQGTAADIIKLAMVRVSEALSREGLRSQLILQVHDELIIEAPLDEVDRAKALLRREMEGVIALQVPLSADVSSGRNWNECK